MVLMRDGLEDFDDLSPPDKLKELLKRDRQAWSIINLCISGSQSIQVRDKTTTAGRKQKLKSVYARAVLCSKLYLWKLDSIKMPENGHTITDNQHDGFTKLLKISLK